MISTVKKEITIQNELLSKIKWENALVKDTKIILPLNYHPLWQICKAVTLLFQSV